MKGGISLSLYLDLLFWCPFTDCTMVIAINYLSKMGGYSSQLCVRFTRGYKDFSPPPAESSQLVGGE